MIRNRLLSNIFFGSELNKLDDGTAAAIQTLKGIDNQFHGMHDHEWDRLSNIVKSFFGNSLKGVFGGPITAGDGFFIAAYVAAFKPTSMIEVGVCSGVSSAFILHAAQELGLTRRKKVFLHSIDLLRLHGENKDEVGRVVRLNYPNLMDYWSLNVEVTAPQVALDRDELKREIIEANPTLAFIDANHMHPWPTVDLLSIAQLLPKDSWVLLQDTQVMERWLANAVEFGVQSPTPCRGVNLVTSLWPGSKVIGWDMCYNMGAVKLDISQDSIVRFTESVMAYPGETGRGQWQQCRNYLAALTGAQELQG